MAVGLLYQDGGSRWRPFEEARAYVRSLGLGGNAAWQAWARSGKRPHDIPSAPERVYKDQWIDWGDWLGTGAVAPQKRPCRPFEEARAYVRGLGLKTQADWCAWKRSGQRPADIPAAPDRVYKARGWLGWGDWLGTGAIANQDRTFRPFEEARTYARALGLTGHSAWLTWAKSGERPPDIPTDPLTTYKAKGWIGWGDWLGTGTLSPHDYAWRPFEEARAYVRGLGLTGQVAYQGWAKSESRPDDIPTNPQGVYKGKGWTGWGDWLGTGTIANQDRAFRPFVEARSYARALGLRTGDEWADWAKSAARPADIPSAPERTYRDQWIGMSDWLGVVNHWRRKEILAFLQDLLPRLSGLSPMVLFEILRRNGVLAASEHASNGNKQLLADLVRLSTVSDPAALG